MKRAITGVCVGLLFFGADLVLPSMVQAGVCIGCPPATGSSSHSSTGYVLTVRALRTIDRATGGPSSGSEQHLFYDFLPACVGNAPGDGDVLCVPALRICRRTDPTGILYYVFRGTDPNALANVGTVCLGDADFVDRKTLDRDVLAQLMRRLPLAAPVIRSAPGEATLVHLPTVFWAANPATRQPDAPTYSVSATVDDVRVTLTVTGTWVWRLDDGHAPTTLHTSGTPYLPGRTPDPRVDPAYYTGHGGDGPTGLVTSYDRRGSRTVVVTVTWTPSYTVDYEVGTRNLDTAAVTYTARRTLRVGEARAVLVAGRQP